MPTARQNVSRASRRNRNRRANARANRQENRQSNRQQRRHNRRETLGINHVKRKVDKKIAKIQTARANARKAFGNIIAGKAPFPNGALKQAFVREALLHYQVPSTAGSQRGLLFCPTTDSMIAMSASSWSATWSEVADHPEKANIQSLTANNMPLSMIVTIKSMLDADSSPCTVFFGQVSSDNLTTAIDTMAKAKALLDINGQPLKSMVWGAGSQASLLWKASEPNDEVTRPSTATTVLGNTFSSGEPYSRLLVIIDGSPASVNVMQCEVKISHAFDVAAGYDGFIESSKTYPNPQLAAVSRAAKDTLPTEYIDQGSEQVEDLLESFGKSILDSAEDIGTDDVEAVVTLGATAFKSAGNVIDLIL